MTERPTSLKILYPCLSMGGVGNSLLFVYKRGSVRMFTLQGPSMEPFSSSRKGVGMGGAAEMLGKGEW